VLALFSLAINLLILTSPLYMMQVLDRVLGGGRVETLIFLTLIAGVVVLGLGALESVRGCVLGRISCWLERRLASELIAASLCGALAGKPIGSQALRSLGTMRPASLTNVGCGAPLREP
jgi:ABC-type protease/lipase transport system fused ATPase/permease subunit